MPQKTASSNADVLLKPLLRGHIHQAAFFVALGACAMLASKTGSTRAFVAVLIYSLCLLNLFGTSALYHRKQWLPVPRARMRRLDHCAIFLLIAGTTTPICLLALSPESGTKLLTLVWAATSLGILQTLFWLNAPKWVAALLAIGTGWLAAPFAREISDKIGPANVLYLLIGGILYTVGAVVYAVKRPNPSPKYFGYHEIFHLLVLLAAILHFAVIARIAA